MRARILLGVIICLLFGVTDFAAHAVEAKKPTTTTTTTVAAAKVRDVIDKSVKDLTERIKSAKDLKSVWKDLAKVEADAKALRKKEKRQSEFDEIHLDSLRSSLEEIPRDKKFVKSECDSVKNRIIAEFSPYPKEDGEYPDFVNLTTGVLAALCAK